MEVLVFKTNIRFKKNIHAIGQYMEKQTGILKWNIDLKDADKILRIETVDLHPAKIEGLVKSVGYNCEELKD
ncbi:MAG TPA: hypothetical protein VGP43_07330 [Chitinophagaceae bacterium]|nr:hypothetical protein [Chitinophagaceae bacterium]